MSRYPSDLRCSLVTVPEVGITCGQSAALVIEPGWQEDEADPTRPPRMLARCMDHYRGTIAAVADLFLPFVVRRPYDLQEQDEAER